MLLCNELIKLPILIDLTYYQASVDVVIDYNPLSYGLRINSHCSIIINLVDLSYCIISGRKLLNVRTLVRVHTSFLCY